MPLLLVLLWIGVDRGRYLLKPSTERAFMAARRAAVKQSLAKARQHSSSGASAFASDLANALSEQLALVTGRSVDGLTRHELRTALQGASVKPPLVEEVLRDLDQMDAYRFAPAELTSDLRKQSYARIESLVRRLQNAERFRS
jgi:hypothetical protein